MKVLNETSSDLEKSLAEYGLPAEVEAGSEQTKEKPIPGSTITSEQTNEDWVGNPAYYQSGSKAGQKRPLGTKPKLKYVHSQEETVIDGELLSGALFLTFFNMLLPMLFCLLHNWVSKDIKLKPESMELPEKTLNKLAPTADKVVRQIQLSGNPTTVMILTMLGLYGMQMVMARMEAKVKANRK